MSRALRPHHGMCFQFYEGKGYSEDYTDHMGRVIREMEADPAQMIQLKVETELDMSCISVWALKRLEKKTELLA